MHVRNAGLLIFAWGVAQAVMNWPPGKFIPVDHGYGGSWHQTKPTGLLNMLAGIGVMRFTLFGKWWGLLFARLRVAGCLFDVLCWLPLGLSRNAHVLDPMPLVVQQFVMGPFFLAQAYIIWVLTREEAIARFQRRTPPPPIPSSQAPIGTELTS